MDWKPPTVVLILFPKIFRATGYSTESVGDSMKHHNNTEFSTKDRGNTQFARFYKGGWWYNDWAHSNLNGLFKPGQESIESIHWWYWLQNKGLAGVEIKLRPR
ncbi:hypothetical protein AVEN_214198-1 [Araneus ventricosus]|uniref:Fibrinogen C-terminal domain-containing protein n=1 Tax=Araneus ventricosus TaxID=182803 RepID=A0A4Y2FU38_ARAVE|nr:hypothetical protein AVEN_214198-1 [Araneus ventricosus]